jgi:glycosyltransferase involved in cell wall biosynthesis
MKTILYHSNSSRAFTGFGKNTKNILRYLFKTGKYKIIEFENGSHWGDARIKTKPWENEGSLPSNPKVVEVIKRDPLKTRVAGYGGFTIDDAIKRYKPDVYLGVEDIWAFSGFWDRAWWKKTNPVIWTTLDSLPLLPEAVDNAEKIPNFYVWASFAEREMQKLGHNHVKTISGAIDHSSFFKLPNTERQKLRQKFGLSNEFIIGFVFRNQLRKSVPNLLEGFKQFKAENPNSRPKLLLHTNWSEGWDINRLLKEKEIKNEDILTTYFCSSCNNYAVVPFAGQKQTCPYCNKKDCFNTVNVKDGVDEHQLNEIYNLMDVYCHPFTSGGMEIPIFEAKLTELITLVTDYSCGEDSCTEESGGLPLQWAEYREPGTQFIKASTSPSSICEQLFKVFSMSEAQRIKTGKRARKFTIDNYSIEVIGKKIEEMIDALPEVDKDSFDEEEDSKENHKAIDLESQLDEGNRLAIVIPQSAVDVICVNSLLDDVESLYRDYDIYIFTMPQYMPYIDGHPAVHKVLPYSESIDDLLLLEGVGKHKGFFDLAFFPHSVSQKAPSFMHSPKYRSNYEPFTRVV